jgi:UDP-N-acetylmuramate dehydrogenase
LTEPGPALADLTTLHVGGPARRLLRPATEAELIEAVADCDRRGEPVLVLGGGSNVVVSDAGFEGTVVHTGGLRGIVTEDVMACSGAFFGVAAGEPWDGVEALSGIPGSTGATPIQNVGAYGQEVSATIARVRTWDRELGRVHTLSAVDCRFGYRSSVFKRHPERWVVLGVSFQLRLGPLSEPVRYAELAARLGIAVGERAPLAEVREAVLALRRGKGMVLDADDHDTWSAGSFFTNPMLTAAQAALLPADAPRHPAGESVKTSAAWLIEHAGFGKGYGDGPARLSSRHTLAITNRGGAAAADVLALAREVRDGVERRFGVRLVPEPVLIGCRLEP